MKLGDIRIWHQPVSSDSQYICVITGKQKKDRMEYECGFEIEKLHYTCYYTKEFLHAV